ncbi:MAG: Valine-tRNA ligase [Microgenomates group bacterium GW2011_GWA1_Microgenomates_45_10]|nr:MAG: Valine-tRNA ligase [Microgenomates group bacterium GW2011_GWA1_Microgenomates_45_10]
MSESNKPYNPKEVEAKIYQLWEESGFFNPDNLPGERTKNFVTCIAPPNITGELHMGHALETTLQDILVRMKRMQGYKTLWLPGTDHAGIAAQNVVEKQLSKEGLTRHELGREKFLERMWQWRKQYGDAILEQFKKLGLSVDWSRTKFTMDPAYQTAVKTAFQHYHKKGWIYQGERVINWCPRCATSVSDLEVNYVPEKTKLYFIKYGPFTLATTRPETKLGDTALAVHPDDERYKQYVGQELTIESVDSTVPANQLATTKTIKILVVADSAVDKEFGTGIVKVTPAHDLTDSEIGQRHNLPSIKIIDEQARMSENAGLRYAGLKVAAARELIVSDLQTLGLIEKIEDYDHNIGRCDRCNTVIEPLPSKQWFLKMKELAQLALKAVKDGQTKIHPERWIGPYQNWLNNVRDWNISRQLWWGHQIPIEGETDVLDTWFSSALWPMATLGWPDQNAQDFKEYYPTNFITSDRGILFLWQVRMIFSGMEFTNRSPFKDLYIHATVLTKDGKRMSKSLGTGINPLELVDKYGTDALRFGLASQATGLQDVRFGEDLLVMGKKFANKLWNIARFVNLKTGEEYQPDIEIPKNDMTKKIDELSVIVTKQIEQYRFAEAANALYEFVWHEFADKYIESAKDKEDEETKATLFYLLTTAVKLLHPFMPFITEEIYGRLNPGDKKDLLMIAAWPEPLV